MENKTKGNSHKADNDINQSSNAASLKSNTQNNLAIVSMVTGVIALFLSTIPIIGFLIGVVALVVGIVSLKKASDKGMSIAGISTGGLSILINIFMVIFIVIAMSVVGEVASQPETRQNQTENITNNEFPKGETAIFNNLQVKVNSVTRNYQPKEETDKASNGKELVIVNVSIKNTSQYPVNFGSTDLGLNADGVTNSASTLAVEPILATGELSSNTSTTGNIIFEIKKDATNLKLQYETYSQASEMFMGNNRTTIYTLGL